MKHSKKEAQTISYYHQNAQQWFTNYDSSKPSFWISELQQFQQLLPHGHILDIGVGGGREAAYFIEHGYTYTGIDPAQGIIEHARKKLPQAQFIVQSVYDLDGPSRFDGFWCSAVLLHIPHEHIDQALQTIKSTMKPGALGFISIAQRHGDYAKEYFDALTGRYFYLHEQEEFVTVLHRNGFIIEKKAVRSRDTELKWLSSWLTFFVLKK